MAQLWLQKVSERTGIYKLLFSQKPSKTNCNIPEFDLQASYIFHIPDSHPHTTTLFQTRRARLDLVGHQRAIDVRTFQPLSSLIAQGIAITGVSKGSLSLKWAPHKMWNELQHCGPWWDELISSSSVAIGLQLLRYESNRNVSHYHVWIFRLCFYLFWWDCKNSPWNIDEFVGSSQAQIQGSRGKV